MLQQIDINKLYPHPANPRKNLGDLSELAESIKARGILQNLTVVPMENKELGFCVVIGHRRVAAAKMAGLTDVPCVICDMDYKDQVATMLLENIQRNDLTVIEQAQGFQMMMDLGETVASLSGKTGFSDATIRRRLHLASLDAKKLQAAADRGGTLIDYAELEKIKDIKLKNKVLESIGTSNFKWNLQSAVDEESMPERKAALIQEMNEFASAVKETDGLSYVAHFNNFKKQDWYKKPKDAGKEEYFYKVEKDAITLYKKATKISKKEPSPKEKAFNKKEAQLKSLSKKAYEMRSAFIKDFTVTKRNMGAITDFTIHQLIGSRRMEIDSILKMLNIGIPDTTDYSESLKIKRKLILDKYAENPGYVILVVAYSTTGDGSNQDYYSAYSWENKIEYCKNQDLDAIYDELIALGYEMSDEEQQLRDGSHELFSYKE